MSPAPKLAQAMKADPLTCDWGFYLSAPEGLAWFASARELSDFVGQDLWPALSQDPAPEALARLMAQGPALNWALLDRLNELLEPLAQIHWWGSLQQLYAGEDPFAKDLREAWRHKAGRGPQDFSQLEPQEQQEFAAFLRTALRDH